MTCWGGLCPGRGAGVGAGEGLVARERLGAAFSGGAGAQRAEHPRLGSGAALEQGRVLGTGHRYCLLDKSASLSSP